MDPRLKDIDFAALAVMAFALLSDLLLWMAADVSLLAKIPPQAGMVLISLAAFLRWRKAAQPAPAGPAVDFSVEREHPGTGEPVVEVEGDTLDSDTP